MFKTSNLYADYIQSLLRSATFLYNGFILLSSIILDLESNI